MFNFKFEILKQIGANTYRIYLYPLLRFILLHIEREQPRLSSNCKILCLV